MQQIPTMTPITSSPNGEDRFRCSTSPELGPDPSIEHDSGACELHKLLPLPRELRTVLLAAHMSDVCVLCVCAVIIRNHIIVQAVASLA